MKEYKLNEMEQAIFDVLKDWNLNCSEDDDLKQELARQIEKEVIKLNEPAVSKCEEFEREASCKHSDWTDLYYSSGDYYGRYCNDCGEFFE